MGVNTPTMWGRFNEFRGPPNIVAVLAMLLPLSIELRLHGAVGRPLWAGIFVGLGL